jgi:N-acetylneuraminate 9-O-acetyltransferase
MNEYARDEFHDCLGGRRVVFAGDSTVRQIYWAAATRLDHEMAHIALLDVFVDGKKHMDLYFEAEGVKLEFIWDPWLNSSRLETELTKFKAQETFIDTFGIKSKEEESAALVILGSPGLWAARHGEEEYFEIFRKSVRDIRPHLKSELDATLVSPVKHLKTNYVAAPNQILLAPVQVPWYESLAGSRAETITRHKIEKMNSYLASLPWDEQSHILWSYDRMSQGEERAYEETGIHVVNGVAERKIDIALNARCNSAVGNVFPHKQTCCMKYPETSRFQVAVMLATALYPLLRWVSDRTRTRLLRKLPSNTILEATNYVVFAVFLCIVADRSHLFVKVDRHYHQGTFIASCLVFGLASLITRKKCTNAVSSGSALAPAKEAGSRFKTSHDLQFLPRDQCDEWKGLMQALILIYHYSYASQTMWVYKIVRLAVAAYIYLSGYGHTLYLLETEDYSLSRLASVVFRLNLLSALLPYAMDTDYKFYYFAPTVTFWYLVVWLTLRIGRGCNQDPVLLWAKVIVASIITTVFILVPAPLAGVSTLCRVVFHMSWDSGEARFRLGLDRYIVFWGMMTASIVHRLSVVKSRQGLSGASTRPLSTQTRQMSSIDAALEAVAFPDALMRPLWPVTYSLCCAFTLIYVIATQAGLTEKNQFNIAHPYMSWIPIMSYVVLRNAHWRLRESYLALAAALGKISLETYVLQYHIWLGSDATAVLRVGLWDRFGSFHWLAGLGRLLEMVVVVVVFLGVSSCVHSATQLLARWLFYNSPPPAAAEDPVSSVSRSSSGASGRSSIERKERCSQDDSLGRPRNVSVSDSHGAETSDGPASEWGSSSSYSENGASGSSALGGRSLGAKGVVVIFFLLLWAGNVMSR